ncbi:MAG: hypothetical protein SWC96_02040 [Thermodesulfobacteriota bacterium]|nr:hypothetical protein [Thermodesulfobacteriota bacterium]
MAANFKIMRHPNSENLHLRLMGDFDGASAMELLNVIEDCADSFQRIFVHTAGLSSFLPFGEDVFVKQGMAARLPWRNLVFTGDYSGRMAPVQGGMASRNRCAGEKVAATAECRQ